MFVDTLNCKKVNNEQRFYNRETFSDRHLNIICGAEARFQHMCEIFTGIEQALSWHSGSSSCNKSVVRPRLDISLSLVLAKLSNILLLPKHLHIFVHFLAVMILSVAK